MPVYSFGEESPIKFDIPAKLAQRYNEAAGQFFKAQQRFNQKFGRTWDPEADPIKIDWSRPQKKAWSEFGKIFDKTIAEKGPFHVNDIMDDYLVLNVASVVVGMSERWRSIIGTAVTAGALYGYFRGL